MKNLALATPVTTWASQRLKWSLAALESGSRETGGGNTLDDGVFSIGGEHIGWNGEFFSEPAKYISDSYFASMRRGRVKPLDVLLVKDGATIGKLCHITDVPFGRAAVNEHVYILRSNPDTDSRFLFYFLQSLIGQQSIQLYIRGSAQPGLSSEFVSRTEWRCPPLDEQRAIAAFLDGETARIDHLIAKKQRLDELLTEKIRSLQSLTVTGNAQPQSRATTTDIPWLPSCPNGWLLLPLRRVVKWIEQGWSPSCDGREAEADEWGVLKAGCVNTGELDESENKKLPDDIAPETSYQIRPGDVLMSRACGTASLVGSVAFVRQCREKLLLCDKVFRLHPISSRILPEFLAEALKSMASRVQIEQSLSGADGLANNITQSTIKEIIIAVPPLAEQRQICLVIDGMRKQIHGLRINTQAAIASLKEYRSALITAAVTGQIDIRQYRTNPEAMSEVTV